MEKLTLEWAQKIVAQAMQKAAADYKRPICVSVCDQSGFLLAFGRMDTSPIRCIQIAQRKAFTAVRMGVATDVFLSRLRQNQLEASYFDESFTALPGGNPIKDKAGNLLGAVGVSGLAAEEDQAITEAMAAMAAAGEL
jgi:glc operon protein GlcG